LLRAAEPFGSSRTRVRVPSRHLKPRGCGHRRGSQGISFARFGDLFGLDLSNQSTSDRPPFECYAVLDHEVLFTSQELGLWLAAPRQPIEGRRHLLLVIVAGAQKKDWSRLQHDSDLRVVLGGLPLCRYKSVHQSAARFSRVKTEGEDLLAEHGPAQGSPFQNRRHKPLAGNRLRKRRYRLAMWSGAFKSARGISEDIIGDRVAGAQPRSDHGPLKERWAGAVFPTPAS